MRTDRVSRARRVGLGQLVGLVASVPGQACAALPSVVGIGSEQKRLPARATPRHQPAHPGLILPPMDYWVPCAVDRAAGPLSRVAASEEAVDPLTQLRLPVLAEPAWHLAPPPPVLLPQLELALPAIPP